MEKETPEENLNQACVRVLKEMTKETPEHDKYNCEECRENMREYTKETPYEKLKRETDELETDKLNRIDKGMYEASGGTPTECPDCKCTNLVSDQCKGECLCHHPELTQTEELEETTRKATNLIVDYLDNAMGVECDNADWNYLRESIRTLLSSHDAKWQQHEHDMYESLEKAHKEELAELARKIEGMPIRSYNISATQIRQFVDRDAVLALLGKKNV